MSEISIALGDGRAVPAFASLPASTTPAPGVVVIHDALGMTDDVRRHVTWLASAGYLAAAPDLYHWGGRLRCLVRTMRDLAAGASVGGRSFEAIAAVRRWLSEHEQGTGVVGIIGFCLRGGFAFALASGHGYAAAAPNYGGLSERDWNNLGSACPIVASYGADDPTLKGQAERLRHTLSRLGVAHDVYQYPGVGHGFMNDHAKADSNLFFDLMAKLSNTRYDAAAAEHARARILAFFEQHLRGGPAGGVSVGSAAP